jgi:hypothetical protein
MTKRTHEDEGSEQSVPRYVWASGTAGYDSGEGTYGEMLDAGDGGILPGELIRDIVCRYMEWRRDNARERLLERQADLEVPIWQGVTNLNDI